MKVKLLLILVLFINTASSQTLENFFKYSTFYASSTMNTPFMEREDYIAVDKGYVDITEINDYDYNTELKEMFLTPLLLVILLVGSIYLTIRLFVIVVKSFLNKTSG